MINLCDIEMLTIGYVISDVIRCPRLANPINGHMVSLNEESSDVKIFACARGTQMIGPEIRVCQRNATWTGTTTYCESIFFDNLVFLV